jgi:hypothetical protein
LTVEKFAGPHLTVDPYDMMSVLSTLLFYPEGAVVDCRLKHGKSLPHVRIGFIIFI